MIVIPKLICIFGFLCMLSLNSASQWKEFTDKENSDVHIFYEPEPSVFNGCGCRDGQPGRPGRDGKDGQTIVGPAGKDGVNGVNGRDGKNGRDGSKGEKGDPGPPGKVDPKELEALKARVNILEATITAVEKKAMDEIEDVRGAFELRVKHLEQLIKKVNATRSRTPGPRGPVGPEGPQGIRGAPGLKGKDGSPGKTGAQGARGPKGERGPQGSPGMAGSEGPRGEQGPRGPPGENGANALRQCRFGKSSNEAKQKYSNYVFVEAKASMNYKIIGASCSTRKSAEGSLYKLENGQYMCACTGKTKGKYSWQLDSRRIVRRDDDDKDRYDCIINYWECPIV
ncbi:collagen alpha-1(XXIII) chain-like [Dendronephthya gigantea]|uniref:collagen alpha-1(XXIII) chain-like n=1 Tax=Dendronephthya gigantea TaxID=151771 RepID=UPI0010698D31|nr:collagen alpha-1(XXIII) chain-like [Dendronephthya gigantea]